MIKKIIVTGGNGRFGKELQKVKSKYKFTFLDKKKLDIQSTTSIQKNINKFKPDCVLHLAGLSRPMSIHENKLKKSIDLNIIGTANLVKSCSEKNIKLIFFSTSYVYPGKKGNYKEDDALLPWNNYGWSKLGAEASVQMYKNSLIIRACMTERPFIHKSAFSNVISNFIFHDQFVKLFLKVIDKKGVINIGGKSQTIFRFAKSYNKKVKKIKSKKQMPLKMYMNLDKFKKLAKK
tara:strand:+ start:5131 stop:5832 length:702 start_codon:yes stop_codon:yes gene_type:complete